MSHVENSRLVEFSFGAESLFKVSYMFITSTYELTFENEAPLTARAYLIPGPYSPIAKVIYTLLVFQSNF